MVSRIYFKLCDDAEFTRGICGLLDRETLVPLWRLRVFEFVENVEVEVEEDDG